MRVPYSDPSVNLQLQKKVKYILQCLVVLYLPDFRQ